MLPFRNGSTLLYQKGGRHRGCDYTKMLTIYVVIVFFSFLDLLKEMLAEEDELKQKMYLKTEEYKRELSELCNDLGLPPKQVNNM